MRIKQNFNQSPNAKLDNHNDFKAHSTPKDGNNKTNGQNQLNQHFSSLN